MWRAVGGSVVATGRLPRLAATGGLTAAGAAKTGKKL